MQSALLRMFGQGCALLLLGQFGAVAPAIAKRTQAQLAATFKDRTSLTIRESGAVPSCIVTFTDIIDERKSPEIVGVVGQRGVLAPKDVGAWLQAVLGGLAARGIRPVFTQEDAGAGAPVARFTLQTAWIASTEVTYSANVVVQLKARSAAGRSIDQTYRGRVSRTAYWSGGIDTLQSAMDGAFANALDVMASDLSSLCGP
jgi:hypothetical protein